jgi:hypothetical protein
LRSISSALSRVSIELISTLETECLGLILYQIYSDNLYQIRTEHLCRVGPRIVMVSTIRAGVWEWGQEWGQEGE